MARRSPQSLAILGKGWPFPLRPVKGRLSFVQGEQKVEQSIALILQTSRLERVLLPAFGAGLRDRVFDPNSPVTHRLLETAVRDALIDWEPRITVEAVRARSGSRANVLEIDIDYVVRATNAFYNRVYPFYLTEGS